MKWRVGQTNGRGRIDIMDGKGRCKGGGGFMEGTGRVDGRKEQDRYMKQRNRVDGREGAGMVAGRSRINESERQGRWKEVVR